VNVTLRTIFLLNHAASNFSDAIGGGVTLWQSGDRASSFVRGSHVIVLFFLSAFSLALGECAFESSLAAS